MARGDRLLRPDPLMVRASVCLVNWNTRQDLERCLEALTPGPPGTIEVIVVDNASTDGSPEVVARRFPGVALVSNERNAGYAKGCNQAIALARGTAILLLNPDVLISAEDVLRLADFLTDHPEAAAVAPRLRMPGGMVQQSARSFPHPWALFCEALGLARFFPRSPRFNPYRLGGYDYRELREVDQPMASCLMIRRDAVESLRALGGAECDRREHPAHRVWWHRPLACVHRRAACATRDPSHSAPPEEGGGGGGPMDEQFPLFFNDVDLCWRLKAQGLRIYLWPEVEAEHRHGASTRQIPRPRLIAESHRSLLRYYRKHYRARLPRIVYALTVVLIIVSGWARRVGAYCIRPRRP